MDSGNKQEKSKLETKTRSKKNSSQQEGAVYRAYATADLLDAARKVRNENLTIYKASKLANVPYNSLKRFLRDNEDLAHYEMRKLGRPFALPAELEQMVLKYVIDMQELGFGLTVMQVRKLAYDLAESVKRQHMLNAEKRIASKWWWCKFKERYNLCLRVPENLSAYRASMSNPVIIQDYFHKLDNLLTKLNIKDEPSRIWNVDETGLSFVVKPNKVVCQIGKRYVYKRTYAEKGQTQTLVGCASADGCFIPPFVIFKGIRWNDSLKNNCFPNGQTHISPKGWITAELFLKWFRFFINTIPNERPVVLLMDSHSSHIGPEVISLAKENQIYLMTFPAHTSHLLQPLDVGVYRSLKLNWSKQLNDYMVQHPIEKPTRTNFYELFTPAFIASFSKDNIVNAFRKAGACPINHNAVSPEALMPSKLTDKPIISSESTPKEKIEALLRTPIAQKSANLPSTRRKKTTAECLTPSEQSEKPGPSSNRQSLSTDEADDWTCGICMKKYSNDAKKKTGAAWIQCSFCRVPYHENCQKQPTDEDVYMCDACCEAERQSSESDSDDN